MFENKLRFNYSFWNVNNHRKTFDSMFLYWDEGNNEIFRDTYRHTIEVNHTLSKNTFYTFRWSNFTQDFFLGNKTAAENMEYPGIDIEKPLGMSSVSVWGAVPPGASSTTQNGGKFRVRIKSKHTGKKVDIMLGVNQPKIIDNTGMTEESCEAAAAKDKDKAPTLQDPQGWQGGAHHDIPEEFQ